MRNFGELKNDVGVLVQRSDDSDYLTKIGVWLNISHKLLADIYDYYNDLQDVHNFTTVSGTETYGLPNRFDKPFRLYDLTNKRKLEIITEEEYTDSNLVSIINATTGKPGYARIYGVRGSTTVISTSGDTVQVKSSSSSDTGGIIIRIQGYIDSALLIEDFENITISATSPTTYVAGTKTFYKITHISKSANTTGYITIANSSGTVLEYLAPVERVARHKVLKLGLIPNAAISMRLLFKKTIFEMVNSYDYPFTECDAYLTLDVWGWALKQDKQDQQAEFAWNKAKDALEILLTNQGNKLGPDYQHKVISAWAQAHRNR